MVPLAPLALAAALCVSQAAGATIHPNSVVSKGGEQKSVDKRAITLSSLESDATSSNFSFPTAQQWNSGNGTLWTVEYIGNLNFTETMQAEGLGGDKCRTSSIGGVTFWTCGDMECQNNPYICGFSMGPGFYGTPYVGTVNTDNITNVNSNTFAMAWSGDPQPVSPYTAYGMDTSNTAAINATHGVAYVWEIWRGNPNGDIEAQGAGAVSVTLGLDQPVATRVGPLLSGPDAIQLGLIAIMSAEGYVYIYSKGGPSGVNVARVPASDAVFDATQYQFLNYDSQEWETPGSIPPANSTQYGMITHDPSNEFDCLVYGSAWYNPEWGLYCILCNAFESITSLYVSSTPQGPWSATNYVLSYSGYGSMAHPQYGLNPLYFSQGPDGPLNMFKLTFNFASAQT